MSYDKSWRCVQLLVRARYSPITSPRCACATSLAHHMMSERCWVPAIETDAVGQRQHTQKSQHTCHGAIRRRGHDPPAACGTVVPQLPQNLAPSANGPPHSMQNPMFVAVGPTLKLASKPLFSFFFAGFWLRSKEGREASTSSTPFSESQQDVGGTGRGRLPCSITLSSYSFCGRTFFLICLGLNGSAIRMRLRKSYSPKIVFWL